MRATHWGTLLTGIVPFSQLAGAISCPSQTKEYDGRFPRDNRAWAQVENVAVERTEFGYTRNDEFACRSHPAVLDGYIQMARRETETPAIEKSAIIPYPSGQSGRQSIRSLLREKQAQTRADSAPQKHPSRTPKRESL